MFEVSPVELQSAVLLDVWEPSPSGAAATKGGATKKLVGDRNASDAVAGMSSRRYESRWPAAGNNIFELVQSAEKLPVTWQIAKEIAQEILFINKGKISSFWNQIKRSWKVE